MNDSITENRIVSLEEMSLNAWPSLKTLHYHGCVLRFSNGYTKRSNSVNALYRRGDAADLIAYSEDLYARSSLPVIFKIVDLPKYEELDAVLKGKGYELIDSVTVKTVSLSESDYPSHDEVLIESEFSPDWTAGFIESNHLEKKQDTVRLVLESITVDKIVASVKRGGTLIGFGFGAIENGYVGIFDVFIRQDYRGAGYGRKLMESILGRAKQDGIEYSYLQVMDNNRSANILYDKLGFAPAYKYWYRIKRAV